MSQDATHVAKPDNAGVTAGTDGRQHATSGREDTASESESARSNDNMEASAADDKDKGLKHDLSLTPPPTIPASDASPRPKLQSKATTALSVTEFQTQEPHVSSVRSVSRKASFGNIIRPGGRRFVDLDDGSSVRSFSQSTFGNGGAEVESLLGDILDRASIRRAAGTTDNTASSASRPLQHEYGQADFAMETEFDAMGDFEADGSNEEALTLEWRGKLKHFLILSSAGKPIYSRHGDDQLISNTIGVVQTIIATFQAGEDILRSFSAGATRFVILSKGHLHLLAISRLNENDTQLQLQLEALYMQILSTLTLPSMEKMFLNRPSTDLRRPLQGTETLLSALADSFTKGSPSTLLSALECLQLRKSHRQIVNNTFLKVRSPNLLYGLIVAGKRLVSVLRPKKHSLHPGDLQLIFNMLFEAESVRAAGGENWIPLCLPAFNNTGYLYMYVKFRSALNPMSDADEAPSTNTDEIATILISTNKESFFELKQLGDNLIKELDNNGMLSVLCTAIGRGRARCSDIAPGLPLSHFLYKSRANVQYTMPLTGTAFDDRIMWRRLISLYSDLHDAVHSRTTHLKVHQVTHEEYNALAWVTPVFELYCVAGPGSFGQKLAQAAKRVTMWAQREEERLFIIGGAVF